MLDQLTSHHASRTHGVLGILWGGFGEVLGRFWRDFRVEKKSEKINL